MLHGLSLKTSAGENIKVTSHLLRHSFATEMRTLNTPLDVLAQLMKQKDVNVTEYYARHTPSQLIELQQQSSHNAMIIPRVIYALKMRYLSNLQKPWVKLVH
ncbi:Site-specific recombinase XerD [Escherichia coli]|uniref:Site-specific recombinase XerD n=1 Tax=Escherichia coli TaxID=562 RepID=A0A377F501_ECOLX|nr:Site-specific recombinase XerD [Escherichia coli]